jgi:two-component system sensor histidine kinase DesK
VTALVPNYEFDRSASPTAAVLPLWSTFPTHQRGFSPGREDYQYTPVRLLTYIFLGSSGMSGKGGPGAVAVAEPIPQRRARLKTVVWSSVWLFVLGAPASEIGRGFDHPAALATAMLATFVILYLALWWKASDRTEGWATKMALLAPLTVLAVVGSLAFHRSWVFLFFFVSAAVACAFPRRWSTVGIVAVAVLDAVVVLAGPSQAMVLRQILGVLVAGLVVLAITRLLELVRELNTAREELARLAVADERVRFARDLHDLLGHTLSLIVVKSEAVRRLVQVDAEAAVRESADIELVSRQALAEVREAVTNYRERSLDVELEGARAALSAAGIDATINQRSRRFPDPVESVLGWTVREGVTNVVRHSNGRHCAIDLHEADGMAVLEICDDGDASVGREVGGRTPLASTVGAGVGVPAESGVNGSWSAGSGAAGSASMSGPGSGAEEGARPAAAGSSRAGSGLRGLAERLAAAHGRLEAGRRPDGGFRLAVTVPLEPQRQDAV